MGRRTLITVTVTIFHPRSSSHGFAPLFYSDFSQRGGIMSCIGCARNSYFGSKPNRTHSDALLISAAGVLKVVKLFAVVLIAATLAACAQSRMSPTNLNYVPPLDRRR